jgi:OmpA-OmpF porin, OOP family
MPIANASAPLAHRLLASFATVIVLLGTAQAQPADDPGLDDPKKAPPAPAPAPAAKPPAPTTSQPASPPMAAAPGPVRETKSETVSWIEPGGELKESSVAFYDRNAAVAYGGPVGLLHILTGDAGRRHTFRASINFSFFRGDSFLIKGNSTVPGDTNSHFAGDLTISYTPWEYIELYAALFNSSNKNERTDPERVDPQVILALGDFAFGLKGRYPVHRSFDLALHAGLRFLNSVSGISFSGDSTNFAIDLIGSLDVRKLAEKVPLRFHLNFGYLLDNSINLLPEGQCARSVSNDPCIRSRVVQTFAYGIAAQRLRFALAADVPLLFRSVGLQPFIEYHAEIALGDGDSVIERALSGDPNVSEDRLTARAMQYMTFGVRLRPVAGLQFTAAVDAGLTSPGFIYGPPTMPWNVILGLAYAYDGMAGKASRTKVITRTITRVQDVQSAPPEGRVRGVVRDSASKKSLGGVMVRYPDSKFALTPQITGEDGTFVSYGLLPGQSSIEVSREDYETQKVTVEVRPHAETPLEIVLVPKPPQASQIKVRVTDETGMPLAATVRFVSSRGPVVDADPDPAGGYQARLPAGDYSMDVVANGYLSRPRQVQIEAGKAQTFDVQLRKKPKVSHVSLGKGEIVLKGVIHFDTNNVDIRPDSQQLLDEVVDILVANPQIKRVRVEGHTDNRGVPAANVTLSKGRARSVMAYLIKQGIDPTRLESEGYGANQPLVPNITAANRARNRRVAFKILE